MERRLLSSRWLLLLLFQEVCWRGLQNLTRRFINSWFGRDKYKENTCILLADVLPCLPQEVSTMLRINRHQGTCMVRGSLHNDITFVHRLFHPIIENELDGSLQNHSEIDTLSSMHDVYAVLCISCGRKVYDAAVDTCRTYETDLFPMYIDPGTLCFCGNSIRSKKVGESWDDSSWWIAFRVKGICWRQDLVAVKNGLPVGIMPWLALDWCHSTILNIQTCYYSSSRRK